MIDIGERKRKEEHIEFIMRELSHRSKNLLAVVLNIANQTMRTGDVQKFESRLMALAPSNSGPKQNAGFGCEDQSCSMSLPV
ncbi:MAG: HWE histidine kinase domain-containing protein [Rhodoplanes sp.]